MRGLEHALRLRLREGDRLAERIDRISQPFAGDGRDRLPAYVVDVVVRTFRILGRQRVRREERRSHGHPAPSEPRATRSCFASFAVSRP